MKTKESSIFRDSIFRTYLPQNLEASMLQALRSRSAEVKSEVNRAWQASVLWTSFLGLPNRRRGSEETTSFSSIGKNFIGWEDKVSLPKKILNGILAVPVFLPYNLMRWAYLLSVNVLKIFTEMLPRLGDEWCLEAVNKLKEINKPNPLQTSEKIQLALAQTGSFIFTSLLFLGRSFTSPIDNIRLTWQRIQDIANGSSRSKIPFINSLLRGNPKIATFLGIVLCGLSAAITVTAAVLLFKFALPFALVKIAPVVGPKILAAVSHLVAKAGIYLGAKLGVTISAPAFSMGATAILSACALPIARGLEYLKNVAQRAYSFLGKRADSASDADAKNNVDAQVQNNLVTSGNILGSSAKAADAFKASEKNRVNKSAEVENNLSGEETRSRTTSSSSSSDDENASNKKDVKLLEGVPEIEPNITDMPDFAVLNGEKIPVLHCTNVSGASMFAWQKKSYDRNATKPTVLNLGNENEGERALKARGCTII